MKTDIHPEVFEARVTCSGCGTTFTTLSTRKEIRVEVCSKCHPFFTGKQARIVDTEGRVEKFVKKFEGKETRVSKRKRRIEAAESERAAQAEREAQQVAQKAAEEKAKREEARRKRAEERAARQAAKAAEAPAAEAGGGEEKPAES
jgi:large subunit ribosomal protein L31